MLAPTSFLRAIVAAMRHLFVCVNLVASGKPACGRRAGDGLIAAVQHELLARGVADRARVTACGCLGPCFDGPNAVVYPDAVWYGALDVDDAHALVDHLIDGQVHVGKRITAPGE
jgi:(2Fe-2S) ferredoxin